MLEQEQRHAEMARLRQQEQAAMQQQQAKLAPWAKKSTSSGSSAAAAASPSSSLGAEENGGRSLADIQRIEQEEKRRRDMEEAEERRRFAQQVNQTRLYLVHIKAYSYATSLLSMCRSNWKETKDRYGASRTAKSKLFPFPTRKPKRRRYAARRSRTGPRPHHRV